jgi:hypothetical protein
MFLKNNFFFVLIMSKPSSHSTAVTTKKIKIWKNNKKALGKYLYYFFHFTVTLLCTITNNWCGLFDTPCIKLNNT